MFTGEMMNCCYCGLTQKSDPEIESGWLLSVISDKQKYICPGCAPKIGMPSAPKCQTCSKFFHPRYATCPHCEKAEVIEKIKTRIMEVMNAANELNRFPLFCIEDDMINEAIEACKQLESEFKERGHVPVLKVADGGQALATFIEMIAQITIMARMVAEVINGDQDNLLKLTMTEAKNLLKEMTESEMDGLINYYKDILDSVVEEKQQPPNPNLN